MIAKYLVPAVALLFASYGVPACSQQDPSPADRTAELAFDVVEQDEGAWTVVVTMGDAPAGTVRISRDGNVRVEAEDSVTKASLAGETLFWEHDGPTGYESASLPIAALEAALVADGPDQLARDVVSIGEQAGPGSREHRVAFTTAAIRGAAEAIGHTKLGRASTRLVDIATATAARELGVLEAPHGLATPAELSSAPAPVSDCENGCEEGFIPGNGYCAVCCDEHETPDCGIDYWGPYCYCDPGGGGGGGGGGDGKLEPSHVN